MKIEINPTSLFNLNKICEVLYKLHPYVLEELVDMQRSLGKVLGMVNLSNPSLEERKFISNFYSSLVSVLSLEKEKRKNEPKNIERFYDLKKYIQLDTDEYIPIKIFIEIEDPIVGKKVRELVRALEKTRAIEQFISVKKKWMHMLILLKDMG